MNKYQEALDIVKCKVTTNAFICDVNKSRRMMPCIECDFVKAVMDLEELVEKATSKKPIQLENKDRSRCPNCKSQLPFRKNALKKQNPRVYCDSCGQALDWSE